MKDHYYLDNAATTWPKPEAVYRFMDSFFRSHGVNPGRAGYQLGLEAEQMIMQTRRLLAQFFGFSGDCNRVVFTQNATDSLNTALVGLVRSGDHIVTTRLEHNAVIRPTNHLERDGDVRVTRVRRDAEGYVDPDDIRAAIRPETRLVVINHASNVLGSLQDMNAIGAVVAATDALLIVDTAQTAGVVAIDMDAMRIDVLTFTGHKGLLGPMGIGGLIVGEHVNIRPLRVGGTGVDSLAPYHPDGYPFHLESGTVSIPGIAGLNAAQRWFAELGGNDPDHRVACLAALERIGHTEIAHLRRIDEALRAMDGITVYGPRSNRPRTATLSFNVNGIQATDIGEILDADHHLCVRAGLHCAPWVHQDQQTIADKGTVRVSPGYFTDDEDLEQLISAVGSLAG